MKIVACFTDGHTEQLLSWVVHGKHLIEFKTESGSYIWTNYRFGVGDKFSQCEFYTDDERYPIAPIVRVKCV